jgi:hypothetical protein
MASIFFIFLNLFEPHLSGPPPAAGFFHALRIQQAKFIRQPCPAAWHWRAFSSGDAILKFPAGEPFKPVE